MSRPNYLWCYGRVSSDKQLKGDGQRRQEDRAWEDFAARHGFKVHPTFLFDPGVSAWDESNWGPKGQLGKFLEMAEDGRLVRPGDCLGCECWDRLWKTNTRRVLQYLLRLQECKIHLADVLGGKLFRYDDDDLMMYLDVMLVTKRGNEASNITSNRCLETLEKRAQMGAEGLLIHPSQLPRWIRVIDCSADTPGARRIGTLKKERYAILDIRDDAKATLRLMIQFARDGMGGRRIVQEMMHRGIPTPSGGPWNVTSVEKLLRDRRLLGECKRRRRLPTDAKRNIRTPELTWIPAVFPAVCTEGELLSINRLVPGASRRGRDAVTPNPFRNLMIDPLSGSRWRLEYERQHDGSYRPALVPSAAKNGRAKKVTIMYEALRDAICKELREIDPASITGNEKECSELSVLNGQLMNVLREKAELSEDVAKNGYSSIAGERGRQLDAMEKELKEKIALAVHQSEHPLSDSWVQQGSLLRTIQSAADQNAAWLALRARLEETCERIWLLVVPTKGKRHAVVQIDFKPAGSARRLFMFTYVQARKLPHYSRPASCEPVRSWRSEEGWKGIDLASPEEAAALASVMVAEDGLARA